MSADERLLSVAEDLAEVGVLEYGRVRRAALVEDAPPVSDEEEAGRAPELFTQPAVVERGHDGLAGARRRDEQVAVAVVPIALRLQLFEHARLVVLGGDVERHEPAADVASLGAALRVEGFAQTLAVLIGAEWLEGVVRPVGLERARIRSTRVAFATPLRRTFHSIP